MTSVRRTDHDRVRHEADDPDPRWPLHGDLAYDTATSRTVVVIDIRQTPAPRSIVCAPRVEAKTAGTPRSTPSCPLMTHPPRLPIQTGAARCSRSPNTRRGTTPPAALIPAPSCGHVPSEAWSDSCGAQTGAGHREQLPFLALGGARIYDPARGCEAVVQFVGELGRHSHQPRHLRSGVPGPRGRRRGMSRGRPLATPPSPWIPPARGVEMTSCNAVHNRSLLDGAEEGSALRVHLLQTSATAEVSEQSGTEAPDLHA